LGRAWFNENKEAYRFNGTLQDITERQKAVDKLTVNEERFRRLVKEVPVGIVIVSAEDYTIKVVNDMALKIWDKTLEESLNSPMFAVLTEIKEGILPIFENVIKTKKAENGMEYPFVLERKGIKQTGYFNFIFKPILEDNQVSEIMLVAFEVTDTVKAKFELEESERQFKNFVMQSPIAMGILRGNEMQVEMANNALLEQFWHRKREDTIGKNLLDIFPNLSDSKYPKVIQNIIKTGISVSEKESPASLKDETGIREFYVDYNYAPLRDLEGAISGVMVTTTDVTDRVLAREELEQFSKDLEKQVALRTKQLKVANNKLQLSIQSLENRNEELEAFAYVSSHDLQEPLRKIQMFISRISDREQLTLSDKGKTYFEKITDSATRMRILIDDLLAFSRLNKQDAEYETTDLNVIVNDVMKHLTESIEISKAHIISAPLPTIEAIPFQFNQVFTNLISNALKFSKKDVNLEIKITTEMATDKEMKTHKLQRRKSFHKITVSDNGIGFPERMEHKIFEVFQRAHSQQAYKGTGIGLAIVKKIILNHGGAIFAQSKEGEGVTMTMLIPAVKQ
jgi:PAS domain S-box-containing protein